MMLSGPINSLTRTRKAWNLSTTDLAELAGLHTDTIEKFEAGSRSPRLDMLLRWADALGCEVVIRFRGEGEDL